MVILQGARRQAGTLQRRRPRKDVLKVYKALVTQPSGRAARKYCNSSMWETRGN